MNLKEKQLRMDKLSWQTIITAMMTLILCKTWEGLEQVIYGVVEPRLVDDIIMILVTISFWFNAKYLLKTIYKDNK